MADTENKASHTHSPGGGCTSYLGRCHLVRPSSEGHQQEDTCESHDSHVMVALWPCDHCIILEHQEDIQQDAAQTHSSCGAEIHQSAT